MDHLKIIRERDLDNLPEADIINLIKIITTMSVNETLKRDADLLLVASSERSVCHRLGVYIEKYTDLDVDCEYDRRGFDQKFLEEISQTGRITTDLLVHRRRRSEYNALAIEMKFSKNQRENKDIDRLRKLVEPAGNFCYHLVLFIKIYNLREEIVENNGIKAELQWITSQEVIEQQELMRKLNTKMLNELPD